jgi:hypothetical protein
VHVCAPALVWACVHVRVRDTRVHARVLACAWTCCMFGGNRTNDPSKAIESKKSGCIARAPVVDEVQFMRFVFQCVLLSTLVNCYPCHVVFFSCSDKPRSAKSLMAPDLIEAFHVHNGVPLGGYTKEELAPSECVYIVHANHLFGPRFEVRRTAEQYHQDARWLWPLEAS